MKSAINNARFWIWYSAGDCWVKLTLRPGQVLEFCGGGATDEGYSYWSERFEHVGDGVLSDDASDASDCDGPLSRSTTCFCHLGDLQSVEPSEVGGPRRPAWRKVRSSQRDVFAERAGY